MKSVTCHKAYPTSCDKVHKNGLSGRFTLYISRHYAGVFCSTFASTLEHGILWKATDPKDVFPEKQLIHAVVRLIASAEQFM